MSERRRILIADPSRVARMALVRHLGEAFDIREENDGESAWQTLVLDGSIAAVVAAIDLSRISGYELLTRLRENRLRRLAELPFFLLVSQGESAPDRAEASRCGVSDFIVRGSPGDEIHRTIARLVNWEIDDGNTTGEPFANRTMVCRHLCNRMAEISDPQTWPASIIAFGLEAEEAIVERYGAQAAVDIGHRFARVIRQKLGPQELMGHFGQSVHVVASPATSLASATAFAQRVCAALGESKVTIGDETLQLGLSAGIASLPTDHDKSAAQLIDAAVNRLALARHTPGSQVVTRDPPADDPFACIRKALKQENTADQLGETGHRMLPLLALLEQQFHFGLPLETMEEALKKYAGHQPDSE